MSGFALCQDWFIVRIGTLWIYIDTYDAHIVHPMNTHEYMWAHRFDVYVSMSIRSAHSINRLLLMHSVHTMWIDNETCDIYTFDVNVSMCIYMVHSMNRLLLRHSVHTMWIDNNTYDIYVSMSIHSVHNMWLDNDTYDIYLSMSIHSVHTKCMVNDTYDIYVSMSIHILHNMHRYCVCQYE